MFSKVLIANRGAIATRAERTLARMGVASVAVYSQADRDSLHVTGADEAVCLGEGTVAQTYLDADKVVDACKSTGAQAVFPGYGFLSENAEFAERLASEGIAFIGPEPNQIRDFGLKHVARGLAEAAGVPLVPGTGLLDSAEEAVREAERIGFPVALKSTAGGGGIGISVCRDADELKSSFESARHLAASNFGNDGVFLEKYVTHARHVEVQVFGADGSARSLAERDCSVQRRNQKVVEECPAPNLPDATRKAMLASAERLMSSVGYRSAGTVEFLYDQDDDRFYFLEVNTRLQVEHGITEECCGVDLVEWMVLEASGEPIPWDKLHAPQGCAIEVRCYAEDAANGFRPSTGTIDDVVWGPGARIETWVRKGSEVTSFFDPMLAKIIVHEPTREQAVNAMAQVLAETRVYGVVTNLRYIASFLATEDYRAGRLGTRMLDGFAPSDPAIEVMDGGIQSTVQDYPGIVGYWQVGIPPCGPMDQRSFRVGNAILGNPENAAGIELTFRGGSYRFRGPAWFCLTGADMHATLDGSPVDTYRALHAETGSVLSLGTCDEGMRAYLCVEGGLDVHEVLGSKSTFIDGRFGGHGGRALRTGDVIAFGQSDQARPESADKPEAGLAMRPSFGRSWTLGVIVGPLSDGEFLKPEFFETLTGTAYRVNHDSARTGVRLNGPAPEWSREDGGEAGLHPSNIHDNPYSICALDLTGDQPILLGPDGPSLGGFVCPVVVAVDERWKLGQMRPGDEVRFTVLSLASAAEMRETTEKGLEALRAQRMAQLGKLPDSPEPFSPDDAILYRRGEGDETMCVRQSGEDALLVEYGPMKLDIALRFKVHVLMQRIEERGLPLLDLTPGIRSLQLHFDPSKVSRDELLQAVVGIDADLGTLEDLGDEVVESRIVHLPLSWDDPQTQLAARRYQETTRPNAPWCPSNPEFIRRINGLGSVEDVRDVVFKARYLVLGLGDVYLGAPVATPIDPRHRLVTTKYNPARPWTPENAVGIGGAYLCVYGMEGPGGYQFVGRTTQMWNRLSPTESFKPGKPWLLEFFDQLSFYPVSPDELLKLREDCLHGRFNPRIEKTTFSLREYRRFLEENRQSIEEFESKRQEAFDAEHRRWVEQGLDVFELDEADEGGSASEDEVPEGCVALVAPVSGAVWKVNAQEGSEARTGEPVMVLESMKMEFPIEAPTDCTVVRIAVEAGKMASAGQTVAVVKPLAAN